MRKVCQAIHPNRDSEVMAEGQSQRYVEKTCEISTDYVEKHFKGRSVNRIEGNLC